MDQSPRPVTKENNMEITREDIKELATEAGQYGDMFVVEICEQALAGDMLAWRECERIIAAVRAMED